MCIQSSLAKRLSFTKLKCWVELTWVIFSLSNLVFGVFVLGGGLFFWVPCLRKENLGCVAICMLLHETYDFSKIAICIYWSLDPNSKYPQKKLYKRTKEHGVNTNFQGTLGVSGLQYVRLPKINARIAALPWKFLMFRLRKSRSTLWLFNIAMENHHF